MTRRNGAPLGAAEVSCADPRSGLDPGASAAPPYPTWRSPDGVMELRCGRYQDVLADVEPDAVITDPPYSERTHAGHDDGTAMANCVRNWAGGKGRGHHLAKASLGQVERHGSLRRLIDYSSWSDEEAAECVSFLRCSGWWFVLTDHVLAAGWAQVFDDAGFLSFSPLACVERGGRVRMAGDGPSQWSVWGVPARPRDGHWLTAWRASRDAAGAPCSLPGAYVIPRGHAGARAGRRGGVDRIPGGKPLWLMRAIVRDYSRPGDLICDPCAGGGTTLLAAAMEGRRAIGAEMDPVTWRKAVKRLQGGYTPPLPGVT